MPPTTSAADVGDTWMDVRPAVGADTVTATKPVMDVAAKPPFCALCAVTVMVAVPAAIAVTTPVAETVAIAGALVP